MITIDFIDDSRVWPPLPPLQSRIESAISCSLMTIKPRLPEYAEAAFIFSDNQRVQSLNLRWRDEDKPTNVLSFASNKDHEPYSPLLGDIFLALETIKSEADEQSKSFEDHLIHLSIHGFLHLLGYDHVYEADGVEMEQLEIKILFQLGIVDPYGLENNRQ
ncbi:rRNA maturation RNase YbeY [Candidatus Endowatersipora endosymbiont of Watersipora subatra]|uniref:rRNA maturation RNase YbeY n=1 Tax=Candidatus Endowatersipora endosymbiont of Watersipora subatra TaxID=3077946 RepID=UPI00312CBB4E